VNSAGPPDKPNVGVAYAPAPAAGTGPSASTAPMCPAVRAGTETATEHPGYLEGAIQSGLRVAAEIIEALGSGDAKPEGSRTGES
ncbi:FAD-dependent oxidoreductase, partial [Mycolicibacterium insubricum]